MATLAHITNPATKRQVARNLQVQAWYIKAVNDADVFDLDSFELRVLHGLYRHEGTPETLSPGSVNDLARFGRAITYQVVNKRTNQQVTDKAFDVAVFLKNFMPFDKLILEYDNFNPDGSLMGAITIIIPNIPENTNGLTFKNEIETKYNGNVFSSGELVEVIEGPQ